MRNIRLWQVGRIPYADGLKLQKHVAELHKTEQNADTLLIVEHPPVYTTGIRTKNYNESEAERLRNIGAEFYRTNRGGLITFHGPGQLVAYPIINLKNYKSSMRWYVNQIENTIIHLCKQYELDAKTTCDTGVWVNDKKICAIGVHGSRFITSHGLGLNCCTELKWFKQIVPCGLEGKEVTSLSKELNRNVTIEEVVPLFLHSFTKTFDCSYSVFPKFLQEQILAQIDNQSQGEAFS